MEKQKVIAVDVDDVMIKFVELLLKRYNDDWDDNLEPDDIKSWNMTPYVKPECGYRIYDYFNEPRLYDGIEFVEGSVSGVHCLREMGYRVVFVTSTPMAHSGVKRRILMDAGVLKDSKDYIEASDKSLIASHYLLDDNADNVINAYGRGIVFTRPHNKSLMGYPRVHNWDEAVEYFKNIKNEEINCG